MTDPFADANHRCLVQLISRRIAARATIVLPALPDLHPHYMVLITELMHTLGRAPDNRDELRTKLDQALHQGWKTGGHSRIQITWDTAIEKGFHADIEILTEDDFANWDDRGPTPFGTHADAKIWNTAETLAQGQRNHIHILDIGAGTGRNALALARYGYWVDAVEKVHTFAADMRAAAVKHHIYVNVIEADIFAATTLAEHYQLIIAAEVVTNFYRPHQLDAFFTLTANHLAPGGQLLISAFITKPGYTPTEVARQLARYALSAFFTPTEITTAATHAGLHQIGDDSVHDYEKTHLPEKAWPPTEWFPSWTTGRDVYGGDRATSPIELHWLTYEKTRTKTNPAGKPRKKR